MSQFNKATLAIIAAGVIGSSIPAHAEQILTAMNAEHEITLDGDGSDWDGIADVHAKGVWRDGRWYLKMFRRLDTRHADDAEIPRSGTIERSVAAFDYVGFEMHSVSKVLTYQTVGSS